MKQNTDEIIESLFQLFGEYIPDKPISTEMKDMHFFASGFGLQARDLVYLTLKMQEKYDVTFLESEIISDDFFTISGLGKIIASKN